MKQNDRLFANQHTTKPAWVLAAGVLLSISAWAGPAANALPTGGTVQAGQAAITQNQNTVNVNQASQRAVIGWNSFNVGKDATVNFNQPNANASTLNIVNGASKSMIDGAVNANGQVIFVNPNGVVFGKNAEVNVGGMVATTMKVDSNAYMAGGDTQTYSGNGTGKVVNKGHITVNDVNGYVALMAPEVRNEGVIKASLSGKNAIALVSGEQVTIQIQDRQMLSINVDASSIKSLIQNKRLIQVEGGQVLLAANSAKDLKNSVVQNTGVISATGITNNGGVISLRASTVIQNGTVAANSSSAVGGEVSLTGNQIKLESGSVTSATGAKGGGQILVGTTSAKPDASALVAKTVDVKSNATVDASATQAGNGGNISIWSTQSTSVAGILNAKGGSVSGHGGQIETSSSGQVTYGNSLVVDTTAANGKTGTWTTDPLTMTIDSAAASVLTRALSTTNVVLDATFASCGGVGACSISATPSITFVAGADIYSSNALTSLTLNALGGNINIQSNIAVGQVYAVAQEINVSGSINSTGGANGQIYLAGAALNILGQVGSNGSAGSSSGSGTSTGTRRRTSSDDALLTDTNIYVSDAGKVTLLATSDITIGTTSNNTASISANGLNGGSITIVTLNGNVKNYGVVDALGLNGSGGSISIAGSQRTDAVGALMSVDGLHQGGVFQIGVANAVGTGATLAPPSINAQVATLLAAINFSPSVSSTLLSAQTVLDSATLVSANAQASYSSQANNFSKAGSIYIAGNDSLNTSATITANADIGGLILLSSPAGIYQNAGYIQTNGGAGLGGTIAQSGLVSTTLTGSTLEANGQLGGGNIVTGRDFQASPILNSATQDALLPVLSSVVHFPTSALTVIDATSRFSANAVFGGNAGNILVWGNQLAAFGTFNAKALGATGNGGFIETSGQQLLLTDIQVSASATNGSSGTWLLDPFDVTIANSGASGTNYAAIFSAGSTSTILASSIVSHLNAGTNVSISTGSNTANTIFVTTPISATGGGSLTLTAGTIELQQNITTGGAQTFNGAVALKNNITLTAGTGNVSLTGGVTPDTNGSRQLTINAVAGYFLAGGDIGSASYPLASLTLNALGMKVNQDTGIRTVSDLILNLPIVKDAGTDATLTLRAGRHISLEGNASISASTAKLNVLLNADTNSTGDGIILFAGPSMATNGGYIQTGTGSTLTSNGSTFMVGGDVYFIRSGVQTINTSSTVGGGDITIHGELIAATSGGLGFNAGSGNVAFKGSLNSGNAYTYVNMTGSANTGSWDTARTSAKNGTNGGSATGDSYLVTITSRLENSIAGLIAGYRGAFIGAWRPDSNSYNWTWADGPEAGRVFFIQGSASGTAQANGYTQAGWYSNFGSGEPNGNLGTRTSVETVGQFFGSAGQWNDLSHTTTYSATQSVPYNVLGFVRETNSANSALTVNTTGNVSFEKSVGTSKPLASLNVTGNQVNFQGALGLDSTGGAITNAGTSAVSGVLSGAGPFTKAGSGTLTLAGANTYTGLTTISTGTLKMANPTALGAGAATVVNGAVLDLSGTTMTGTNALTLNGTGISNGGALTNSSSSAATYAGAITLASASSIASSNGGITVSGVISGSGNLSIEGTSAITFTRNNTYTGSTTVSSGATLNIQPSWTSNSNLTGGFVNNGTVNFSSNQSNNGSTVLFVTNASGSGAWNISSSTSGNNIYSNRLDFIGSPTTTGPITVTNYGNFWTEVAAGTTPVSFTSPVYLNGSNTVYNLYGLGTIGIGTLTGTGKVDMPDKGPGSTITLNIGNDNGTGTFSGVISNSGAQAGPTTLSVVKVGTGTQTLSGVNTYSGTTTVNNGTLAIGGAGQLGSGTYSATLTVASGATFTYGSSANQTFSGSNLAGAGTINLNGTGTVTISGTSAEAFTGVLNISQALNMTGFLNNPVTGLGNASLIQIKNGGTLTLLGASNANTGNLFLGYGSGAGVGVTTVVQIDAGGLLTTDSSTNVNYGLGRVILAGGMISSGTTSDNTSGWGLFGFGNTITVTANSTINASQSVLTMTGGTVINIAAGATLTLSASNKTFIRSTNNSDTGIVLNQSTSCTGGCTGTLLISTANTQASAITVKAGTLKVGHATALGTGAVTVQSGGVLDLNGTTMTGTNALTLNGTGISSGGALTNSSSTAATYAGAITLASASSIASSNGGITVSGVISGSGNLSIEGTSAITFTRNNTYTGSTTVSSGATLNIQPSWTSNSNLTGGFVNNGTVNFSSNQSNNGSTVLFVTNASGSGAWNISSSTSGNNIYSNRLDFIGSPTTTGPITVTNYGNFWTEVAAGTTPVSFTSPVYLNGSNTVYNLYGLGTIGIGTLTGTGKVDMPDKGPGSTITLNIGNDNGTGTFSGVISNSGAQAGPTTLSVVKVGTGTQTLSGVNTYSGTTTVNNGTLAIGGAGQLGSGTYSATLTVASGATFTYGSSANQTFSGSNLAGAGTINLSGTGSSTVTVTGNGLSTGSAESFSGVLNISQPFSIGSGFLNQASSGFGNATLIQIKDGGTLTLNTSGVQNSLVGSNVGNTVIQIDAGGTLTTDSNTGATFHFPALILAGGTLTSAASTNTSGFGLFNFDKTITVTANSTISAPQSALTMTGGTVIDIAAGVTLTVNGSQTFTRSASGADNGLILNKNTTCTGGCSGTLIMSSANTYTGGTTLTAGTLKVANGTALGAGSVTVASGAVLDLNGTTVSGTNALTLNGTGISSAGALTNSTATAVTYAGSITLGTTASSIGSGGGNITLSGAIGGTTGLTINGGAGQSATVKLSGNNTYTGGTTVSSGTLQVGSTTALGASGSAVTVSSGAVLDLNGNAIANSLILNGTGISSGGALTNSHATPGSVSGTVALSSASSVGGNAGNITLGGVVSGSSALTKIGTNTLTLSAANSYSGGTSLSAGMLVVSNNTALGSGALTMSASTILQAGATTVSLSNPIAMSGAATINAPAGNTLTLSGVLSGAGTPTVNTGTTGTVLFTNSTNTFGSATAVTNITVSGGILGIVGDGSLGVTPSSVQAASIKLSGGVLQANGLPSETNPTTVVLSANRGITLTAASGLAATATTSSGTTYIDSLQVQGVVTGAYALTINGANQAGIVKLSGANTYIGVTTITSGTLQMGYATAMGAGGVTVASGAVLDLNGTAMAGTNALTLNGTGISSGGALVNSSSSGASYAGSVSLGSTTSIGSSAGSLTVSGVISGSGNLAKVGTSTVILSGANTYTGTTTVNSGILRVSHASGLGNGSVIVGSTATLDLAYNGIVTLGANLTMSTGASLTNSTNNSGLFVTGESSLNVNITTAGAQTFSGAVTLGDNITLTTTNSNVVFNTTVNGTSAGAQSLTIANGSGTIALVGNVGGNVVLSSLNFSSSTASTLLGGSVTTTGSQNYAGSISVVGSTSSLNSSSGGITVVGTISSFAGGVIQFTGAGSYIYNGGASQTATSISTLVGNLMVSWNGSSYSVVPLFSNLNVSYLVVGGGGGGGGIIGGGGGGGGVLTGTTNLTGATSIVVGIGGLGGVGWNNVGQQGSNGTQSSLGSISAAGGGYGGAFGGNSSAYVNGGAGGSGGGGSGSGTGGSATPGQGNNGGNSTPVSGSGGNAAAGGGGAGAVGFTATTERAGNGGAGLASNIAGTTAYYGGGGGGGARTAYGGSGPAYTAGTGGIGGGGNGTNTTTAAGNGTANTGGGGGGAGYVADSQSRLGGAGGSGIVVLSVPLTQQGLIINAGAGAVSVSSTSNLASLTINTSATSSQVSSGIISGATNVIFSGTGSFSLNGANTYTGTTSVNAGTLKIGNPTALGTGAVTVASGAALDLNGTTMTGSNALTLNGIGISSGGALTNSSATTGTYVGAITLSATAPSIGSSSGNITLSGNIGGASRLTINGGSGQSATVKLSGNNTYTGGTTITSGTVVNTSSTGFGSGAGALTISNSAQLDLQNTLTVGSLSMSAGSQIISTAGASALTVSGASTLGTTVTTTGTQTYNGSITLNGNTSLTAGLFSFSNATTSGAYALSLLPYGASFTGTQSLAGLTLATATTSFTLGSSTNSSVVTLPVDMTVAGPITVYGGAITVSANLSDTKATANSGIRLIGSGGFTLANNKTINTTNAGIVVTGSQILINNPASNAIAAGGTGNYWNIWSSNTSPYNATASFADNSGGLAYDYKQYNIGYGTSVSGTGNGLLFSYAPTLSIGLTGTVTKAYDGTTTATMASGNYSVSGNVGGDVITYTQPTTGTYAASVVGVGIAVSTTGISFTSAASLTGKPVYGYQLANTSASSNLGVITAKQLTATLVANNKVYDASSVATGTLTLSGFITGDTGTVTASSMTFASPNVAYSGSTVVANTVTASGLTLGAGLSNYALASTTVTGSAAITPAPLTITATNQAGFVTRAPSLSGTGFVASGLITGQNINSVNLSTTATSSSIAANYPLTISTATAAVGTTLGNYSVTYVPGTYTVVPADGLLITSNGVSTPYGTNASVTPVSISYLVSGGGSINTLTNYTVANGIYTFADGASGAVSFSLSPTTGSTRSGSGNVNVGSYALTAGNFTPSANLTANAPLVVTGNYIVTPKSVSVAATSAIRTYSASAQTQDYTSGILSGDLVTINGLATGTDAGTYSSNLSVTGTDKNNYTLAFTNANLTISPATLTVTGSTNSSTYNASAQTNGVAAVSGFLLSDSGTVSGYATGTNAGSYTDSLVVTAVGNTRLSNYTISITNGSLSIGKAALTVTGAATSVTYNGLTQTNASAAVTGRQGNDSFEVSGLANAKNAGAYADNFSVTATGNTNLDNYTITKVNGSLTIGKADLTVTGVNRSVTYAANVQTNSGATVVGTQAGDSFNVNGYGAGINIGRYNDTLSLSGVGSTLTSNYNITYNNGALTVTPAALTITGATTTRTYTSAALSNSFTTTGLLSPDTVTGLSGLAARTNVGTSADQLSNATGSGLTNYTITYVNGSLTVAPATLTVTGAATTQVYTAVAQNNTFSTAGLLGSDSVSAVSGSASAIQVGTVADQLSAATGTGLSNYNINYVNGSLTITQAPLTITGATTTNRVYTSTLQSNTYTTHGLLRSDAVTGVSGLATGTNVGTTTDNLSSATGPGLSNYNITYVNGSLTITRAPLTITGATTRSTYTALAQTNSYAVSGLLGTDAVTGVSGVATRTNVGTTVDALSSAVGSGLGNYTISYVNGALSIAKVALTITGATTTNVYSGAAQSNKFNVSGLLGTDTLTGVAGIATATNVGTTADNMSTATGQGITNYTVSYVNGSLTITPAALTIAANNAASFVCKPIEALSYTSSGLLGTDTISTVTLSTTATSSSAADTYPITVSNAVGTGLGNYTITYQPASYNVVPAGKLLITTTGISATYASPTAASPATVSYLSTVDNTTIANLSQTSAVTSNGVTTYSYSDSLTPPTTVSFTIGVTNPVLSGSGNLGVGVYGLTVGSFTKTGSNLTSNTATVTGNSAVNPLAASITGAPTSKAYTAGLQTAASNTAPDGYTSAGLISGDNLTVAGIANGTNVGSYQSTLSVAGSDAGNYTFTIANNPLNITPVGLTITGGNTTSTYNATTQTNSAALSVSGLKGNDAVTSVSGLATGKDVGSYSDALFNATGTGLGNYSITYINGGLTVTPAYLTAALSANSKVYDATPNATGSVALNGVLGSDSVNASASSMTFADALVGTAKAVTVSNISLSGNASHNYRLNNTSAASTADITPAALTITGSTTSSVYNGTTQSNSSSFTTTGLFGTDQVTSVSGQASGKNVGTFTDVLTNAAGSGLSNYAITYSNGAITITPATLNVTGASSTGTYNGTQQTNTYQVTGLQGTDGLSVTGVASGLNAGNYNDSLVVAPNTGTSLGNYSLTTTNGSLAIARAPISAVLSANDKMYDATTAATGTVSLRGLFGSDVVVGTPSAIAFSDASVGTAKAASATGVSLSGAAAANYVLTSSTATGQANITSAPLTIAVNNQAGFVTQPINTLTYSVTGLLGSDSVSSASMFTTAGPNTSAGIYPLTISGAQGSSVSNYAITYQAGTYTVVPAGQVLVVTNGSTTAYGSTPQAPSSVSASYLDPTSSLINPLTLRSSNSVNDVTTYVFTDGAGGSVNVTFSAQNPITSGAGKLRVGIYGIGLGTFSKSGTNLTSDTATVTGDYIVTPLTTTITANNQGLVYSSGLQTAGYSSSGLLAQDNVVVSGRASGTNVGSYQSNISTSGTDVSNYAFTYVNRSFAITPAALTIAGATTSSVYNGAQQTNSFTSSGLLGSDSVSAVSGQASGTTVGTYNDVLSGATGTGLSNYNITYTNGSMAITPAPLTVTGSTTTRVYTAAAQTNSAAFTSSGLLGSDSITAVSGQASGTTVGTYNDALSGAIGTGLSNYNITYTNGSMAITPKALQISGSSSSKIATGSVLTNLATFTTNGLVGSDLVSAVSGQATGTNAGTYTDNLNSATGTGLSNYSITYVNGTLEIKPAPANAASNAAGALMGGGSSASSAGSSNVISGGSTTSSSTSTANTTSGSSSAATSGSGSETTAGSAAGSTGGSSSSGASGSSSATTADAAGSTSGSGSGTTAGSAGGSSSSGASGSSSTTTADAGGTPGASTGTASGTTGGSSSSGASGSSSNTTADAGVTPGGSASGATSGTTGDTASSVTSGSSSTITADAGGTPGGSGSGTTAGSAGGSSSSGASGLSSATTADAGGSTSGSGSGATSGSTVDTSGSAGGSSSSGASGSSSTTTADAGGTPGGSGSGTTAGLAGGSSSSGASGSSSTTTADAGVTPGASTGTTAGSESNGTQGVSQRAASFSKDPSAISTTSIQGIKISINFDQSQNTEGLRLNVVVEVSRSITQSIFEVHLPNQVVEFIGKSQNSDVPPRAKLATGDDLPEWIKFDPESLKFVIEKGQSFKLPQKVEISLGEKRITVDLIDLIED